MRGVHYLLGAARALWMLLVADDLAMIATHTDFRESFVAVLVFLRVMGFPLCWRKTAGGTCLKWVGYELSVKGSCSGHKRDKVHATPP